MAELNLAAKLKNQLKQEKIHLWNPPYTDDQHQAGQQHMQELAQRYSSLLALQVSDVGGALESIRVQAVNRLRGNKRFRELNMATVELLLPRDSRKDNKAKTLIETRLDVLVQQLMDRIGEEFGLKSIKLILNGKTLIPDQTLDTQGVKNHSKMMVLKVTDGEEEKNHQHESIQRTQKGFQILSERDGSEDPDTSPFLEIADQKGEPLKVPHSEKKALILAMGFHEKGRSLMKKKEFEKALCHLLQADHHFSQCGSALLRSVDNFAVLQLDIVWCYRALKALTCLDDARRRLQSAEDCFLQCYGQRQQRLLMIKGNTGREDVLFLRLYLLQSLLSYIEGNDFLAKQQLDKVESLYRRVGLDSEKMTQLMILGFTDREARLGLRACQGNVEEAAIYISNQRQEKIEQRQRERMKRSRRLEVISTLAELGYSRRDASRAAHLAEGDLDKALGILLDSGPPVLSSHTSEGVSADKLEQLLYLGFERDSSRTALRLTGGDVQSATQLLIDHQGVLSAELLSASQPAGSSSSPSPSSEEPSTSSISAEENELVNEALEDICPHEEDYLDLTLEEESELINTMKGYLKSASGTP
ncbi:NEDD8 ultimate buster 1 [Takifugu rubripes]|uniref:Negative regulator of ubiquitin-like proteins 1 n=1 Tax=Takifugu rubripes TaxID=31033 RepID=H2V6H1_TAKRU|nr:NEDD8 ultimate buster 1 [Takifugu rubripes]XP_011606475.2 NEDD8 ultimate buster 1 [Takifugu rubripes]